MSSYKGRVFLALAPPHGKARIRSSQKDEQARFQAGYFQKSIDRQPRLPLETATSATNKGIRTRLFEARANILSRERPVILTSPRPCKE